MKADRDRTDILIVSAHLPELSGLRSILGDELHARVGGLDVVASAVGIGIPAAAAGTAFELGRRTPRAIVLIGTCGAYGGRGHSIGQVVVGHRIHLVSAAAASGRGAFPAPMPVVVETARELSTGLANGELHEVDIATTLTITTDDVLAATLAESVSAEVEHLEAFGAATACDRERTAFGVVLGIANIVGASAREEWRLHHHSAGSAAAAAVARWITSGAPGLKT